MQVPPTSIVLRAATADDDAFMCALYATTREEEMKLVPWTDEQKRAFLDMQFRAQKVSYLNEMPEAEYYVIVKDNTDIGRLIVDRSTDVLLLADIALLPEYRNQGIGSDFIERLKKEAVENNQCMRLHVESFNPAFRLYQRLGFKTIDEHSFYWRMEWNTRESATQAA